MCLHSFPYHLLFLLPIFIFIHVPKSFCEDDERYSNCSRTFDCGNITGIGYPFCGNERPDYCGVPEFEIKCQKGSSEIKIKSQKFQVLGINQSSRIMRIHRKDDACPESFDNTPFNYADGVVNLTLWYGCSSSKKFLDFNICAINGTNIHGCLVNESVQNQNILKYYCNNSVIVPVPKTVSQDVMDKRSSLDEVLKRAFDVTYTADDTQCSQCAGSGGTCGYDSTLHEPTCHCRDQPHYPGCSKGSKFNWTIKLIIGFSSLAGGTLICLLFFVFYRRRHNGRLFGIAKSKNLSPSSTPLSGNMPSNPTSEKDIEKGSTYFGVHIFTYDELEEATNNFDSSKELGDGGFGTVYYGKLRDGRVVAVKRLYENNYKRVEQFMNEVKILTRLRHQNLVTLYGCTSRHSRELLLVYEFVPNGTVADHLHGDRAGSLTWPTRMSIAIETASALSYLHASDIIHRDVKTNNILLDNNFRVKVADFGLSRLFPTDVSHVSTAPQGTPGYVDPDYHQCYQLTDKSDVYSFGVVLIELISSKPAVDITRHRHEINLANLAINKIQNHALHELIDPCLGFKSDNAVKKMTTLVAELAFRCLQLEKEMRPSMDEVLTVLREIESEEYKVKAEEVEISADDVGLLKNTPPPLSPDSVTDWVSQSTTPSASS